MLSIGRLLGAFTAGRAMYTSGNLFQQLTTCLVKVVSLALISAFLFSMLIVGIMYALYRVLFEHGLSSDAALLVIGGIILLALVIFVLLLIEHIKKIKELPHQVMQEETPVSYKLHNMVNAFINGFNAK